MSSVPVGAGVEGPRWRRLSIGAALAATLVGLLIPIAAPRASAAVEPVIVNPTSGVSWGDTITVTTSGYETQEAAYVALCDPGTIGTLEVVGEIPTACTGELEHRLEPGFDPDTNYGFINGANGEDTIVLTDGRPSSAHCATGACDVVVFPHNCIDSVPGGACTFLAGQRITFAGGGGDSPTFTALSTKVHGPTVAATFSATDSDGIDRFECKVDGASYEPCTSPLSLTGLPKGAHTLYVKAFDTLGNSTEASTTFTLKSGRFKI